MARIAFMVHSRTGYADRITICPWILMPFLQAWETERHWDTSESIDRIRAQFPEDPPEDSRSLIEAFWTSRDESITSFLPPGTQGIQSLKDIDMSTGFDMFLLFIVIAPS